VLRRQFAPEPFEESMTGMYRRRHKRVRVVLVSAALLVLLFAQPRGQAPATDALPYSKGYLVTGNYVIGGVDLEPGNMWWADRHDDDSIRRDANGFRTGTIRMKGVPDNADILAAFLFWETIYTDIAQVDGAKF